MNILLLGGQAQEQQQWVGDLRDAVAPFAEKVRYVDYRHWQQAQPEIELEHEINQLGELAESGEKYMVVASSIGTVVTTLANARGILQPKRCIFFGFPLKDVTSTFHEVDSALPKLPPTIFVQNYRDPSGHYFRVRDYFDDHAPHWFDCRQTVGDSRDYLNFDLIADIVKDPTIWSQQRHTRRSRPER